ncbi:hypothetical protein GE21DRAFT_1653 [Neurospora crassa]|uniref:Uncharacterized protein n=1 Tax=Neurospora crassa (strain ATCC 24698 / 74-OR23-1A / CBS 708.71 / DSM 1257 / FGSC 987) TaxID=367110 RepID=Q7S0Q0_NEUCR|nr:hypothetical protein NCU07359 [Neurospora crassa OR74A]EAA28896.2 hypothetical protein NCU07359 [Neurospora crassa OR74A]KHE78499.1 hypothetical protein GE21DRAFT_1653 [Neurospora crassa]|eukprot:XP_958132.2 hypothetical protein NCU07359 [Neurospora crassa OR74A]
MVIRDHSDGSRGSSAEPPSDEPSSSRWWRRGRRGSESSISSFVQRLRSRSRNRRNSVTEDQSEEISDTRDGSSRRASNPPSRAPSEERSSPVGGESKRPKTKGRSSTSYPPLSFFNSNSRQLAYQHQRTHSSAAVLQQRPYSTQDESKLKAPPRFKDTTASTPDQALSGTAFGDERPETGRLAPIKPVGLPPLKTAMPPPIHDLPHTMYPPKEQEFVLRTQRSCARMEEATAARASQTISKKGKEKAVEMPTMVEAIQQSTLSKGWPLSTTAGPVWDQQGMYDHQRRVYGQSMISTTSTVPSNRDSWESRPHYSIINNGSITSLGSMRAQSPPAGPRTSLLEKFQKPAQISRPKPPGRKSKPGELFAALPGEVIELILEELRKLHFKPGTNSCATCWMRDCCNIAISARKFLKYAREALYGHIQLVGADGHHMKKRTKLTYGSRLVLLRRTLRGNLRIAAIVRSLKPPALPSAASSVEEYNDLVASVILACPNFERLVGYYPTYDHTFQRIFQALSTRQKLKEMDWILERSPLQRQKSTAAIRPLTANGSKYNLANGSKHNLANLNNSRHNLHELEHLSLTQCRMFIDFHLGWQQLTTLVVHCHPGATLAPDGILDQTFRNLPSLQNLNVSHLPRSSFTDANLLHLPPRLKKLTLTHLPGITTAGLTTYASRSAATSLTTLTLIHMNLETLPSLARIFSNLVNLDTFNLVQHHAPVMPSDEMIWLFPYLTSNSLRKLHWDIPTRTTTTSADDILAKSILAGGFPRLTAIRCPNDPEGVFQTLCKPKERADHPTDRYRGGKMHFTPTNTSGMIHHARSPSGFDSIASSTGSMTNGSIGDDRDTISTPSTPTDTSFPLPTSSGVGGPPLKSLPIFAPKPGSLADPFLLSHRAQSDLHLARLAAQARIEAARKFPRFFIIVTDPNGEVVDRYGVGAFIGRTDSKITYVLTADEGSGATDEGGGLVTVDRMLGDCGEALVLPPKSSKAMSEKVEKHEHRHSKSSEDKKEHRRSRSTSRTGMREWWGARSKSKSRAAVAAEKAAEKAANKVEDVMVKTGAEEQSRIREGCIGRWNTYSGSAVDKKDRERWWHTERGRWRPVVLS